MKQIWKLKFDFLLFLIITIVLFDEFNILDVIENISFILYLSYFKKNFSFLEKLILTCIFKNLESFNKREFFTLKYHLLFTYCRKYIILSTIENLLMFETDFIKIIKKILIDTYFNQLIFLKLLIIVFLCLACQYVFFKKTSNNSKRKIYHIYIFFIFYNCNIYVIHCSSILIYFLLFVSTHWNGKLIFKNFINKKDKGKYVLSHIFILAGCTFPYFFLTQEQYTATLISICLQDAAASFAGKFLRSNTKTLFGLITGFIVANITYFLLNHKINQKNFFAVIGLIEYLTESNDNLVIPFFAVLYFKIQNLIFESNQY